MKNFNDLKQILLNLNINGKRYSLLLFFIGATYSLSLLLPAIDFSTMSGGILPGIAVVLFGTIYSPFALIKGYYGILAIYANFIFLFLFIKILTQTNHANFLMVSLALFMLVLSGFSFSQSYQVHYMSSGKIVVWGIGAVFWFFSLFALAALIFYQYFKGKTPNPMYFIAMLMIWLSVAFSLRYYQYHYIAEEYNQKRAFQWSVVFISQAPFLAKTKKAIQEDLGFNND